VALVEAPPQLLALPVLVEVPPQLPVLVVLVEAQQQLLAPVVLVEAQQQQQLLLALVAQAVAPQLLAPVVLVEAQQQLLALAVLVEAQQQLLALVVLVEAQQQQLLALAVLVEAQQQQLLVLAVLAEALLGQQQQQHLHPCQWLAGCSSQRALWQRLPRTPSAAASWRWHPPWCSFCRARSGASARRCCRRLKSSPLSGRRSRITRGFGSCIWPRLRCGPGPRQTPSRKPDPRTKL